MTTTFQARTRDCIVLKKGDTIAVYLSNQILLSGWLGGQGARFENTNQDLPLVSSSDGAKAGFLLWGSDELADKFTALTGNSLQYKYTTLCYGGWLISTSTYERYTYASRTGGGPLVAIAYGPNDPLYFSLRGYWTKEDEWALSGDPRAPNTNLAGYVSQVPTAVTSNFITIHTSI